jgi:hypothetical protein
VNHTQYAKEGMRDEQKETGYGEGQRGSQTIAGSNGPKSLRPLLESA